MTDPRQREGFGIGTRDSEVGSGASERAGAGVSSARVSPSIDQRPLEEIQEPVQLCGGPRISESTFGSMMR